MSETQVAQYGFSPNSSLAVLTLPLADNVAAPTLAALLDALDGYYNLHETLQHAEFGGIRLSSGFGALVGTNHLEITSLQIGTPNVIKLRGAAAHIVAAATFLSTVLGVPIAISQAYKNYQDAQLSLEKRDITRLDLLSKAYDLYKRGVITQTQLLEYTEGAIRAETELKSCEDLIPRDQIGSLGHE